jgi:hypothetical protein
MLLSEESPAKVLLFRLRESSGNVLMLLSEEKQSPWNVPMLLLE